MKNKFTTTIRLTTNNNVKPTWIIRMLLVLPWLVTTTPTLRGKMLWWALPVTENHFEITTIAKRKKKSVTSTYREQLTGKLTQYLHIPPSEHLMDIMCLINLCIFSLCNELCSMHCFTSASFVIAFQSIYGQFLVMTTRFSMQKCKNQPHREGGQNTRSSQLAWRTFLWP